MTTKYGYEQHEWDAANHQSKLVPTPAAKK